MKWVNRTQRMKKIDSFFALQELRTTNEINRVRSKNAMILWTVTALTAITIGFSIYAFFLLKRRIILPLSLLEEGTSAIKDGDYSMRIDIMWKKLYF